MTIHRPTDYVEVYRLKAGSADMHEMSGRTGRPDLTRFVNGRILAQLEAAPADAIVDVGCGDASLLKEIARARAGADGGPLVGILPSAEEVARVRDHLAATGGDAIRIDQGLATQLPLPDGSADKVVVNGVLLLLAGEPEVLRCLAEIRRICKHGARVYLGEIPERNEFADRGYGDSIGAWLWWVLRRQGVAAFTRHLRRLLRAMAGREALVILPKNLFFAAPERFAQMLGQNGFRDVTMERHQELDAAGASVTSPTRWNYLARKA